ncbi:hypothetical protein Hte_000768 [Hypoxylon texense]
MKRIRFLGDRGDGSFSKRKQVKRACDTCRIGKRKCNHDLTGGASPHRARNAPEVPATAGTALEAHESRLSINHQPQEVAHPPEAYEKPRSSPPCSLTSIAPFAGPSSSHSLLLSACTPDNMALTGLETDLSRGLPPSRLLRPSFQDLKFPPSERRPGVAPGNLPFLVRAILPYLEIECLQMLPPQEDLDVLMQIFRQEVHPILPIVDFTTRALSGPIDRENPATIILRQAICLAVCKNVSARQHLKLPDTETGQVSFQKPREFADKIFGALKIAMDIGLVDDRLELVQVLALSTFHSYGPDGDDEVARLCGQAIHYAYSSGLHYPSPPGGLSEVRRVELLYSLFALDKIIAMITGRPAIMRENEACLPAQGDAVLKDLSPGLKLLFRLSQMLDQVLDLYRPRAPGETLVEEWVWQASWPEFEDLAIEYELSAMRASMQMQTCLELLYHAISVLSHRQPQPPAVRHHNPEGLPTPATQISKVRHSYCAQKISFLLSLEMTMFPFVPYAASLSLTVALRNLQQTTLESTKRLATDDVERSLRVLAELAEAYWHAESAGMIGRQLFQTLS